MPCHCNYDNELFVPHQEARTQGGGSPLGQEVATPSESSSHNVDQPPSKIVVGELPVPTANAANTLVSRCETKVYK